MKIIQEPEFRKRLIAKLKHLRGKVFSVVGAGRSGSICAVYASHYLNIPFIPYAKKIDLPSKLHPILLIDTARYNGKTMRKLQKRVKGSSFCVWLYTEPPMLRFWYEGTNRIKINDGITKSS